jgi:magnesium chelatase subunit I
VPAQEKKAPKPAVQGSRKRHSPDRIYPFTAIVGQEVLKRALLLNVVNPQIGGVLIRGEKGTGKSIAVRALQDILPKMDVTGCKFNCRPTDKPEKFCNECKLKHEKGELKATKTDMNVCDLPLNITEDRLVGAIDIERVLKEGVEAFEPGILAEAHRNILYVDEINLLEDNVVDVLLDAAAMGMVTIEREGISLNYPSQFVIIGSMNPEEGELRPQLLDRLALQAEVKGIKDVDKRVEIIKRSREFQEDPALFREKWEPAQNELRKRIMEAITRLPKIKTSMKIIELITRLGIDFNIDGHRGDIIIERSARTNAALEGREETTVEDVVLAAEMALPHRMRKQPFEEEAFSAEMLRKLVRKYGEDIA